MRSQNVLKQTHYYLLFHDLHLKINTFLRLKQICITGLNSIENHNKFK